MPRKTKAKEEQELTNEPKPAKTGVRRPAVTAKKTTKTAAKKPAAKSKAKSPSRAETRSAAEPSDEEVSIRAYFIAERRHRLSLPGDASGDWLEARRQLMSERQRN